jgi:hypothetical protein
MYNKWSLWGTFGETRNLIDSDILNLCAFNKNEWSQFSKEPEKLK